MPRTDRDITADGFEEIDTRLEGIEGLLQQILQVCRDNADGLSEHRQHTMKDVSDMGADVRELRTKVAQLERRAANGGE